MRKILIIIICLFIITGCTGQFEFQNINITTEPLCYRASDCELPMEYAVRSNCPYQAYCFEGSCVIACPMWEHSDNPDESISYQVTCDADTDCDCSDWDQKGEYDCRCLENQCVSIVEKIY